MNKKMYLFGGILGGVLAGFSAVASVCYLPAKDCDRFANYNASVYTSEMGYYREESLPEGYNCTKVENLEWLYKCEPDECITQGYTYVGIKEDIDAWNYIPCPKNLTTTGDKLFYKREAKSCEQGFTTNVITDDCLHGFDVSHNSGDKACSKCRDANSTTCERGITAEDFPEGCYTCTENGMKDVDNKPCYDCKELAGYKPNQHNNCASGWESKLAADGSTCYKPTSYKTREEAGCHSSDYNAEKCTCSGDTDTCPSGYFANVYGDCPQGSALFSQSRCITCAVEVCNSSFGTSSVGEISMPQTVTGLEVASGSNVKRSYVDGEGAICTDVCSVVGGVSKCDTKCSAESSLALISSSSNSHGRSCSYQSIYSTNSVVFNKE